MAVINVYNADQFAFKLHGIFSSGFLSIRFACGTSHNRPLALLCVLDRRPLKEHRSIADNKLEQSLQMFGKVKIMGMRRMKNAEDTHRKVINYSWLWDENEFTAKNIAAL